MPDRIQAVLFDLDGTLLDTLEDLASSGNAVLRKRGHPEHSVDSYRHFIGAGMANLVRRIFPEGSRPTEGEELDTAVADYKAEYALRWQSSTVAYSGIPELLDALTEQGIGLGVLSNKAQAFTEQCVTAFLGDWNWGVVLGQRDGIPVKPDPAGALEGAEKLGVPPETCAFVGDSGVDMQTAVSAGMLPVGVTWGFREAKELSSGGAEALIDHPAELEKLL